MTVTVCFLVRRAWCVLYVPCVSAFLCTEELLACLCVPALVCDSWNRLPCPHLPDINVKYGKTFVHCATAVRFRMFFIPSHTRNKRKPQRAVRSIGPSAICLAGIPALIVLVCCGVRGLNFYSCCVFSPYRLKCTLLGLCHPKASRHICYRPDARRRLSSSQELYGTGPIIRNRVKRSPASSFQKCKKWVRLGCRHTVRSGYPFPDRHVPGKKYQPLLLAAKRCLIAARRSVTTIKKGRYLPVHFKSEITFFHRPRRNIWSLTCRIVIFHPSL